NNAPMPYAIYFTNNGHAFHMGDPAYDSAGCVRLPQQAAMRYWDNLQIGDKVFIYSELFISIPHSFIRADLLNLGSPRFVLLAVPVAAVHQRERQICIFGKPLLNA